MTRDVSASGERLRVAFDMTFPDRNRGGSGTYARELVAALRQRGDIEIIEVRSSRPGIGRTVRWLWVDADRQIRSGGAQLLHSPNFVAPWRVDIPFVMTVFDLSTRRFPDDHPLEWKAYERWFLPSRVHAAARVLAISEVTKRDVIREYGAAPDHAVTVYPGIDDRFFQRSAAEKPLPSSQATLLFPGAPVARKNLGLVLEAMAGADPKTRLASACLQISGATLGRFPEQAERINQLGLSDRVEWLGFVPEERMPAVMASADICVYPSHYEGFGFPPLEAMASGTPVVASSTSCLPEILGEAALLVDPSDVRGFGQAVEATLADGQLRQRLIAAGLERAARFTWKRCAEETVAVYREVLAATG